MLRKRTALPPWFCNSTKTGGSCCLYLATPVVHAAADAVGAANQLRPVLDHHPVEQDGDAGFLHHSFVDIPAWRFKDDVISLPFARRPGGVDERRHLPVNRPRLTVGVGLVLVGIHDLDLVHIVDQNAAVAPGLTVQAAGRIRLGKLHMQLEIRPLALGADIAAAGGHTSM